MFFIGWGGEVCLINYYYYPHFYMFGHHHHQAAGCRLSLVITSSPPPPCSVEEHSPYLNYRGYRTVLDKCLTFVATTAVCRLHPSQHYVDIQFLFGATMFYPILFNCTSLTVFGGMLSE